MLNFMTDRETTPVRRSEEQEAIKRIPSLPVLTFVLVLNEFCSIFGMVTPFMWKGISATVLEPEAVKNEMCTIKNPKKGYKKCKNIFVGGSVLGS